MVSSFFPEKSTGRVALCSEMCDDMARAGGAGGACGAGGTGVIGTGSEGASWGAWDEG